MEVKFNAVVDDIAERHEEGQPILVGTTSVEKSEYLSRLLAKRGVRHEVLNAKHHEREAAIVALAGRKGSVTVATNMAGRGTDIMLGGNAEHLAVAEMEKRGYNQHEDPEAYEEAWQDVLAEIEERVEEEAKEIRELGGLYVLGTERHESRRIDNQLRGRAGRQGDPGESRFYLSLTDDLMRLFGANAAERILTMTKAPEDEPLESKLVTRAILSAQTQIEQRNAEQRKNVLKYDDVLNRQRTVIYGERNKVLEGEDLDEQVSNFREDVVKAYVNGATAGSPEDWDLDALFSAIGELYEPTITAEELIEDAGGKTSLTRDKVFTELLSDMEVAYGEREEQLGEEGAREMERRVILSVIDKRWRDHLYEMDYLKNGIGLRAMAQRDPLVEYQREGFDMFNQMQEGIKEDVVRLTNTLEVKVTVNPGKDLEDPSDDFVEVEAEELKQKKTRLLLSAPSEDGGTEVTPDDEPKDEAPKNRQQRRQAKKKKKR